MTVSAISIFCFVAAVVPGWLAARRANLARDSKSWVSTKGKITRASVESEGTGDGFKVHIRYEFEVEGRKYESSKTDFGVLTSQHLNRKYFLTELHANAYSKEVLSAPYIVVWFDPRDPTRSVLNRSFPILFVTVLCFSSAALVLLGAYYI